MESKYIVGDYVWAKMKGFPAWPAKVVETKPECKKPVIKKPVAFVYFYFSSNYAWISDDNIFEYKITYEKNANPSNRLPKGFKEAIDLLEEDYENLPPESLPSQRKYVCPAVSSVEKKEAAQKRKHDKKKSQEFTAAYKTSAPPHRKRPSVSRSQSPCSTSSSSRGSTPTNGFHGNEDDDDCNDDYDDEDDEPLTSNSAPTPRKQGRLMSNRKANRMKSSGECLLNPILAAFQNKSSVDVKPKEPVVTNILTNKNIRSEVIQAINDDKSKKEIIASPYKIGFLGLGIMGQGMVANLLSTGHEVTVWNRTPSLCKEFVAEGAFKGLTPAEVVASCDITFSCVSDTSALMNIIRGENGVLKSIRPGKFFVDMTSVSPDTVCTIHEMISRAGGSFLECPIIGDKEAARSGKLILLAGGDYDLYAKCYNIFETMSTYQHYCGEAGSAAKLNLVMKMFNNTVMAGLAESVSLADAIGVDTTVMMDVLDHSPLCSSSINLKGKAMVQGLYNNPDQRLSLAQKDMRLAVNLSETVDCPLHVASSVNELFKKAKAKGYGEHDIAAIYRASDV